MLITLKPHDQRTVGSRCHRQPCVSTCRSCPGITLYLQPVQDLTIEIA
jgi:hypothetical protein